MATSGKTTWARIDARIEPWLMIVFYGYFCLIVLIEIVRRYVFQSSSIWGEETARYAFVYLVYVAVAEVAKTRDHIRIDLVPSRLGPKGRFALYLYFDCLYLLLASLVFYYSLAAMKLSIGNDTWMTGLDLNVAWAQAALPLGAMLLAYRVVQRFVGTVRSYRETGNVPLGGGYVES
jgi:TRAP-type C4-dicarboxylate transport system permease small subunit